ncbi:uncharacterized protein N7459_005092 [Penicillium hispanicum]|uniref:uncharacterized protein n=1 Tax=Penicillium hispanicum TaxID=1080232 RepID=UPI00254087B2|nr:uncharacterized protein N7459_005092 [Penicillium hispanicum]KAJ5585292.1 hypothetical protein N7459_005092 [Penicillium hispanicum]
MATAQMPGPRSARLADDAALYATQPRRKPSVRDANTAETQYPNQRVTGSAPNLSHASAGAALAHANRTSIEIWRPGRLTDAEKAALCVKDFVAPEVPQPSTQYSAEGLGAAILAVREQRGMTSLSPTQTGHKHDISTDQSHIHDKALRAATGAYTTRQRSDSAPSEPIIATDAPWAPSAAGASHKAKADEGPLDHLDSAMEASRIHHVANTNARLYTSSPPVAAEVEERNRNNSLRAAAISMAKDMYDVTGPKGEAGELDPAILAAQQGQDRLQARKTVSGTEGTTARRAMTLQDAAQKRAAEKLARMQDEHAELQTYYGTAPQPPRSRLTTRRKRTSSDADASQVDAERSRYIRNQMSSLRTKLDQVDEKRTKDRELLMEAARRNVNATMQDMDMKLYADTGRAPPSVQKEWDEAVQERVRREVEAVEASGAQGNRVSIGTHQYMDMADVEAVARSRVQPALNELADNAEKRRAQELEARLDAEEQQRQAAIEKEREASLKGAKRTEKEQQKRESKGLNSLLWRMKSKRRSTEKPKAEEETVAQDTASIATQEAPTAQEETTAAVPEADAVSQKATSEEAPGEPEMAGAATVSAAAPISPPVTLPEPPQYGEPHDVGRTNATPRDAAAFGDISAMHVIQPVTSPRADSKLKNWFRDRLVRRTSAPVAVYPHQPGPEYNTDSEVGFAGGAALTGRSEPRGAALSSHPYTGDDLDQGQPVRNSNSFEVANTSNAESTGSPHAEQNGNGNSKRSRLRRSFLRGFSRNDQEPKTNGATHEADSRQGSEAASEPKKTTELQGLRDSAIEQGLPVPPVIGETASVRRESRFSEDL